MRSPLRVGMIPFEITRPITVTSIPGATAEMGVMVLAALGVVLDDTLTRINALKQTISLVVNVAAAVVFVGWGPVDWTITLVMAGGALLGGALGGLFSTKVPPQVLRLAVVVLGLAVSVVYFAKL